MRERGMASAIQPPEGPIAFSLIVAPVVAKPTPTTIRNFGWGRIPIRRQAEDRSGLASEMTRAAFARPALSPELSRTGQSNASQDVSAER